MLKKTDNGFSLVEVMIAMTVFMVAAMGLAALNRVSMQAAEHGRDRTAAANLAQYVLARLQNEAGAYALDGVDLMELDWLNAGAQAANLGTWQTIAGDSIRFDDRFSKSDDAIYTDTGDGVIPQFCVEYMVTEYAQGTPDTTTAAVTSLYQVTVRVNWPKPGYFDQLSNWNQCTTRSDTHLVDGTLKDYYHTVVITQVLTRDFSQKL